MERQAGRMGFTLAEVLITLGIIGVVAAMTIPTLMNKTNDLELKTAWKKEYSVFSQATIKVLDDNNGSFENIATTFDMNALRDQYLQYLNYQKKCYGDFISRDTYGYCWHSTGETKYLDNSITGSNALPLGNGNAGAILNDGTYVLFAYQDGTCTSQNTIPGYEDLSNICGWISVDVNGAKKPNMVGKDIYSMFLLKDRIVPFGTKDLSTTCNNTSTGLGCSAQYLNN